MFFPEENYFFHHQHSLVFCLCLRLLGFSTSILASLSSSLFSFGRSSQVVGILACNFWHSQDKRPQSKRWSSSYYCPSVFTPTQTSVRISESMYCSFIVDLPTWKGLNHSTFWFGVVLCLLQREVFLIKGEDYTYLKV